MLKFLVDEDMPKSTATMLRTGGFEALDVRDCGLRGKKDDDVFSFAQRENAVVLTGDWGFGNFLRYPVGSHHGVVIAYFPNEVSTLELNRHILKAIENIDEADFDGSLIIIEPGKVRIRRK